MPATATEPESVTAAQASPVDKPKYPLHALATFELRGYRRQLEVAIAFCGRRTSAPAVWDDLQATLGAVIVEQEFRERLTRA